MGIPVYFYKIIEKYNNIMKSYHNPNPEIDYLFLDSNSIVYQEFYKLCKSNDIEFKTKFDFEMKLIEMVSNEIKNICDKITPKKMAFISIDGVVPIAKMKQQKNRRFMSVYIKKLKEQINNKINEEIEEKQDSQSYDYKKWNTVSITPGTEFMELLDNQLKEYINKLNQKNPFTYVFSSYTEFGEGEHKIFKYIKEHSSVQDNICIYGLDADLIMLSLNNIKYSNDIILYREHNEFSRDIIDTIYKNIDDTNDIYQEYCFLSIVELSDKIYHTFIKEFSKYNVVVSNNLKKINRDNFIQDYVFFSFLLGNDFLPHFPSLTLRNDGMNVLFETYYKFWMDKQKYLIENDEIQWKQMKYFIGILMEYEDEMIQTTHNRLIKKYNRYTTSPLFLKDIESNDMMNKFIDNLPNMFRENELYINPNDNDWRERYYDCLFSNMKKDKRYNIAIDYIRGLEWCFYYYKQNNIDITWNYSYDYPPDMKLFYSNIPVFNTKLMNETNNIDILPITQLAYVIPNDYYELLPYYISNNLIHHYNKNNINRDEIKFTTTYSYYLWEGHFHIDDIDIMELNEIVKNIL